MKSDHSIFSLVKVKGLFLGNNLNTQNRESFICLQPLIMTIITIIIISCVSFKIYGNLGQKRKNEQIFVVVELKSNALYSMSSCQRNILLRSIRTTNKNIIIGHEIKQISLHNTKRNTQSSSCYVNPLRQCKHIDQGLGPCDRIGDRCTCAN